MATQAEIKKRRRELCSYRFRGFPLDKIAELLNKKYGTSKETIIHEWYIREEWIPELFDISSEKEEQVIFDVLAEQKEIKRELWKIYKDADNDNARVGALRDIKNTNMDLLDMMQGLGLVDKAADKHEFTGKDGGPIEINAKEQLAEILDREAKREKAGDNS